MWVSVCVCLCALTLTPTELKHSAQAGPRKAAHLQASSPLEFPKSEMPI